jgi:anti-sigma regulatory factor (Ser/Thr protein kinase)/DNA-binding XRE family transcriptional regulator
MADLYRLPSPPDRDRAGVRLAQPWITVLDGQRLRRARRQHGLSQEKLAHRAGVSLTTVARLERQARSHCHTRTLARLAAGLGEHPSVLAGSQPQARGGTGRAATPLRKTGPESSWRCSRTFAAHADQVARARAFLDRVLADCPMSEDAVLICSELAANAILHSESARPGGRFTVRAEVWEGAYAWVEVDDQGGRWAADNRAEHGGRGLEIVAALADYWDIRGDDTGRVVRARLDWPGAER